MSSLLTVKDLRIHFTGERGIVKAVNGVNFSVEKGEIFGIVGESGSGKTVTGLSIARLFPQNNGTEITGRITFKEYDIFSIPEKKMRKIRGKEIGMIFQNPLLSLNPVFTIGEQISESFRININYSKSEAKEKAVNILNLVGIPSAENIFNEYPHQLSGGMAQRVLIALAISGNPSLIIADEPTANLDVTVQAQILSLIMSLQEKMKMSIIIISHDFGVIAETTDRVAVMYAGIIQEMGETSILLKNPFHPYTRGLLNSIPAVYPGMSRLPSIQGSVPDAANLPSGCAFHPRCEIADEECRIEVPELEEKSPGRFIRCRKI